MCLEREAEGWAISGRPHDVFFCLARRPSAFCVWRGAELFELSVGLQESRRGQRRFLDRLFPQHAAQRHDRDGPVVRADFVIDRADVVFGRAFAHE